MLRGLWKLTWLEIKIFVREPLGVIGTVGFPLLFFVILRRIGGRSPDRAALPPFLAADLPIFAAVMIALSAVVSLVAIVAIYREGGILKRLRATPLRPTTILLAHVLVKLIFTGLSLALLVFAGARTFGPATGVPLLSFGAALLFTTLCLLSVGFILASVVPTARFAQPLATLVVYTMLGFSGLFVAVERMPGAMQAIARVLPLTYAVSLLRGVWRGEGWFAHGSEVLILAAMLAASTALAARLFRWE
jgi:ABC-2 type transport system permease protein